jgi:hypothetical protein
MRKCTASGEEEQDPDLLAADKEHWKVYQTNLATFRSHSLQYETELKASFGEDGYEALLFIRMSLLLSQASDTLREIYYNDDNTKSAGATISIDGNNEHRMILLAERKAASCILAQYSAVRYGTVHSKIVSVSARSSHLQNRHWRTFCVLCGFVCTKLTTACVLPYGTHLRTPYASTYV